MNSRGIQLSRLHLLLGCRLGMLGKGCFWSWGLSTHLPRAHIFLSIFFKVTTQKQKQLKQHVFWVFLVCFYK